MLNLSELTIAGEGEPTSISESGFPEAVLSLIRAHGEGAIGGLFYVAAPGAELSRTWRSRANDFRSRGFWSGISGGLWSRLVVVAADLRGWAMAMTEQGDAYLLAADGAAFELPSLDALFEYSLASFPTAIPKNFPRSKTDDGRGDLRLEIERTYVTCARGSAAGRYLEALARGDGVERALEQALGAEPLLVAYARVLWRLCGSSAESIPKAVREDAIDTVLALAKRREPYLIGTWLPATISNGFDDAEVRAWASAPFPLDLPAGPFALAEPSPPPAIVEPRPDDARPPLSARWVDVDAVLTTWAGAWSAEPDLPVARIVDRCAAFDGKFSVVQLIDELGRPQVFPSARERKLAYLAGEEIQRREKEIVARLVAAREHAWPFCVLALRSVDASAACRLLGVLASVRDPDVEPLLLSLVLRPQFRAVRVGGSGFDKAQYAQTYVRSFTPPRELAERFATELIAEFDHWRAVAAARKDGQSASNTWFFETAQRESDPTEGKICIVAARPDLPLARELMTKHYDFKAQLFAPALARTGAPEMLAFLRKRARSGDPLDRLQAAEALVRANDPEGAALLQKAEKAAGRWDREM